MLNHFDTVFAFVAVLTGVSLVVTSLTQMVGALFAFRGRHLRWGLAGLFANYAPELRAYAGALSGHLLNHPLLSDSVFSRRRWVPLNRWSAAAFFVWRGWKYANAVRPGELRAMVFNLASNLGEVDSILHKALETIGDGSAPGRAYDALLPQIQEIARQNQLASYWLRTAEVYVDAARRVREGDTEARERLGALFISLFQAMEGSRRLRSVFDTAAPLNPGEPPQRGGAWEQWFECTMDRVSQSFATHMRIWTIVFAVAIAVLLPLDSVQLFHRLSADPELRARILATSDDLHRRAEALNLVGTNAPALADAGIRLRTSTEDLKELLDQQAAFLPMSATPNAGGPLHALGILASIVLLGLGAPFWFNVLKKMSNLRPLLANKQDAEEQPSPRAAPKSG